VFALGAVTLALSAFIVPDRLYQWINVLSGALVVIVGLAVLTGRWRSAHAHAHEHEHSHASPEHGEPLARIRLSNGGAGHTHDHGGHHHHHEPPRDMRSLVAVGISGGLLPCPSALVVLLAAISLHRVAFGLLLIVAFSFGLALTITGIGLLALFAKRAFGRFDLNGGLIRFLPAVSALVIVVAGLAMTVRAIPELHV
jgi:nickel/cobalt transporter (NicO) family protein